MKRCERAKIFAPFSPLRGLDEAYRKKERVTMPKPELLYDRIYELDLKLRNIQKGNYVEVVYYTEEGLKKIKGNVNSISAKNHTLTLCEEINFDDIYDIELTCM